MIRKARVKVGVKVCKFLEVTVITAVIELKHPLLVHSSLSLSQWSLASENEGTPKIELYLSDIHNLIYALIRVELATFLD